MNERNIWTWISIGDFIHKMAMYVYNQDIIQPCLTVLGPCELGIKLAQIYWIWWSLVTVSLDSSFYSF